MTGVSCAVIRFGERAVLHGVTLVLGGVGGVGVLQWLTAYHSHNIL